MTNTLLNKRMLAARAFGAAIVGLTTLIPIHAYSSNPAKVVSDGEITKTQTFSTTEVMMDINGDKIQFSGDTLKPTTAVKVNGVTKYFGDLTPKQQAQLREVMVAIPALPATAVTSIISTDSLKDDGKPGVKIFSTQQISMDINGSKIELSTTDLKPTTPVKVNGVTGRFGDLTPKQQQQIRESLPKMFIVGSRAPSVVLTPAILGRIETSFKDSDLPANMKMEVIEAIRAEAAKP
ncbi:MAG: hypothetical protein JWQ02_63 [Capsulimonas sp.]|nr:hypothetical protein [Capsulimonas sp.]